MRRLIAAARRRPVLSLAIAASALVVLVLGAVAGTAYTSRPAFCTSCHEMDPYYAAWNAGGHTGASCVACHVDPGVKAQVSHKFVALKEVYDHFTSDPKFPGAVADVPDSRCLACHDGTITTSVPGFSHESHRNGRSCVDCHMDSGHKVTALALAEAGILNTAGMQAREVRVVATKGAGAANVPGHPTVACSDCHDLAKTGCATCHAGEKKPHPVFASISATTTGAAASCTTCHTEASRWAFTHPGPDVLCTTCHASPAEHRAGACTTCHTASTTWAFEHPSSSALCTSCHTRPASHSTASCTTCHATGVSWKFTHPSSSSCANCHTKPAKHYSGTCSACHSPGVPFASTRFSHPGAKANCANCHAKPKNHYSGACYTCHSPKVAFAKATFKHPGTTATCTNCHTRPSGHSASKCSTCHKTGVSWRFVHPSSTSCASCHKSPSGHYGTTCSNCHSPSRSWSSATFNHPSVPGGEHTYRSFACNKCHPSGYTSTACTTCHESGGSND
jgi:nitrate/TMAO reductase-like tetraheme cytochrome c subunit